MPAPMLALCLHQIFGKQTGACTCACTFGNYAVTYACTCRHYACTILSLLLIRCISFWQICKCRQCSSVSKKHDYWYRYSHDKHSPPAGPSESPRIFGLTKTLGGYHYRQSRNDNRTRHVPISRKENLKRETIGKETSRKGNDR